MLVPWLPWLLCAAMPLGTDVPVAVLPGGPVGSIGPTLAVAALVPALAA